MQYRQLGQTGMKVSELCFGTLPMGPRQKNLDVDTCVRIMRRAFNGGVNFIDTAQLYETYWIIKEAIKGYDTKNLVIATKSAATTYNGMKEAIEEAREELDLKHINIFLLHAAKGTVHVFEERAEAIRCLLEAKIRGKIGAVGIATHSVEVVKKAATLKDIDVVFPLLNLEGMGIIGGGPEDMKAAIAQAASAGKGIYLMKTLAGGNLIRKYREAMDFARSVPGVASIAVGMISEQEVDYNIQYFSGKFPGEVQSSSKKFLIVQSLCLGDGACVDACINQAISLENGKAKINSEKCLLCGYCTKVCPQFAIRMV
ncbi:MAG: hypothetical protein PWP31_1015 [Clostridia bacterium]|nr:hypothetical protein [Clostridia bacterium]